MTRTVSNSTLIDWMLSVYKSCTEVCPVEARNLITEATERILTRRSRRSGSTTRIYSYDIADEINHMLEENSSISLNEVEKIYLVRVAKRKI